jgi:soluble lytic murein transglycosylase
MLRSFLGIEVNSPKPVAILILAVVLGASAVMWFGLSACAAGGTDRGVEELRTLVSNAQGRPAEQELVAIESRYPRTRAAELARFLRGYLHCSGEDYAAATDILNARSIGEKSSLGDYALYYRARSEAGSGKKSDALRDYGILYSKYPESIMARESRLGAAEMAIAIGDPASATKELTQLVEAADPEALYWEAQAYEREGNAPSAIELYRKVYYEHPATRSSDPAAERLAALGAAPADHPGSASEMRHRADGFFEAKQYAEALKAYDDLIARFPAEDRSDQIQLRRGVSQLNTRQTPLAISTLGKVSERDPNLHAEALYYRADAERRSSQAPSATVDRLLAEHPGSRWAQNALYGLAGYLDKQGRTAEANARWAKLLSVYPKSEYAPEASYDLGWRAYQAKRYADAARMLEQHLATYRYPVSKYLGQAGFWAGKAEERLGNKRRALALYAMVTERYRYGYDGFAADRRASALRSAEPALKPEAVKPGSELEQIQRNLSDVEPVKETANGSESGSVARADDLEVIGLGDLAVKELNRALAGAPASPKLNLRLAELYSRRGDNLQATLVLRRAYPDLFSYHDSELPREAWEIFFPLKYWDAIKQESRRYGIDSYVAAGLIRQESVFNPTAISRVGARGLMQLMASTGQQIALKQGAGKITSADLYNPGLNIKLGMNYLAQLIGQFGRIEYAAAGYNAGPGRARQWIAERGSMDIEEWIENIPISETRGYVQSVLRNAANYRRLYKE